MILELIITTAFGLEAIAAKEIRALGLQGARVEDGRITVAASAAEIPLLNLWLRTAERVHVKVGEFRAADFDELYEQTKQLPWPDYLPPAASFPVRGRNVRSKLTHTPSCQRTVKKAIAEVLMARYDLRTCPESGAVYEVEVAIHKDIATLSIDTSGEALHKRGYRAQSGEAPLKETLAAALVYLAEWTPTRPLLDPFCGSGTILIEAALLGQKIAPGLGRAFAAEAWPFIPPRLWEEAREEARQAIERVPLAVQGWDIDASVLDTARECARQAGVGGDVSFARGNFLDFEPPAESVVICNPPYGERLHSRDWRQIVEKFRKLLGDRQGTDYAVLMAGEYFEKQVCAKATKKRKLYNGRIRVDLYSFRG